MEKVVDVVGNANDMIVSQSGNGGLGAISSGLTTGEGLAIGIVCFAVLLGVGSLIWLCVKGFNK